MCICLNSLELKSQKNLFLKLSENLIIEQMNKPKTLKSLQKYFSAI